jgi:uncharacterized repeat protein (TIGR02543 family)
MLKKLVAVIVLSLAFVCHAQAQSYSVTISVSPPGAAVAFCQPSQVSAGGSSACNVLVDSPYATIRYSGACAGPLNDAGDDGCLLRNINSNQSSVVYIEPVSYTIFVSASPTNGGVASCSPETVTLGGTTTCTATPKAGYTFNGWSQSCSGQGSVCTLSNVTSNENSVASFSTIPTYEVQARVNVPGWGVASCSPATAVASGGSSICTATANQGYGFDSWLYSCAGQGNVCTLSNIMSFQSSYAYFSPRPSYSVTASASPTVGGRANCSPSTVTQGGSSTCTATPKAGYTFSGWSQSCSGQGSVCTFNNLTGNKSSVASFEEIPLEAPSAPNITSVEPEDSGLVVSFNVPNDGGSPIRGYTATCGSASASDDSSPIIVQGLTNDQEYRCSVLATNAVGNSPASTPVSGTPEETVPAGLPLWLLYEASKS